MTRYLIYGAHAEIAPVGDEISRMLSVELVRHDSSYRGGDYLRHNDRLMEVIVQRNFEDEEGYLAEPDFAACMTIVYISGNVHPLPTTETDVGLILLRDEEF